MIQKNNNQLSIERILNKNVYHIKCTHTDVTEYEVKFIGESYLNARWVRKQQVDDRMIDEYEAGEMRRRMKQEGERRSKKIEMMRKQRVYGHQEDYSVSQPFENSCDIYPQQHSRLKLLREFPCKDFSIFSIKINTPFKKDQNHFSFGDRVQEILAEVHQLHGDSIRINLGDSSCLKNEELLKKTIFPKMTELKAIEKVKNNGSSFSVFVQVKWMDQTVSKVKTSYLSEFQPELIEEYMRVRDLVTKLWKRHQKREKSKNHITASLQTYKLQKCESQSNQQTNSSIKEEKINQNVISVQEVTSRNIQTEKNQEIQINPHRQLILLQKTVAKIKIDENTSKQPKNEESFVRNNSFGVKSQQTDKVRKIVKTSQPFFQTDNSSSKLNTTTIDCKKIENDNTKPIIPKLTTSRPYSIQSLQTSSYTSQVKKSQTSLPNSFNPKIQQINFPQHQSINAQGNKKQTQQKDIQSYFIFGKKDNSSPHIKNQINSIALQQSKLHSLFESRVKEDTYDESSDKLKRNAELFKKKYMSQEVVNKQQSDKQFQRPLVKQEHDFDQSSISYLAPEIKQNSHSKLGRQTMIFNRRKPNVNPGTTTINDEPKQPSLFINRSQFISSSTSSRQSVVTQNTSPKIIQVIEIEDD